MFKRLRCLLAGLLLLPASTIAMADVIHWELSSHDVSDGFDEGFTLSGGFDFDTLTKDIFNITVQTTASAFCFTCNDYAGGKGSFLEDSATGTSGMRFLEVFKTGNVVDREFTLVISESIPTGGTPVFDWTEPGSFSNLSFRTEGFLRLDDPFDPEAFESLVCQSCASAVGTLVPVPEPETYLMMLAGLAALGWKVNGVRNKASRLRHC